VLQVLCFALVFVAQRSEAGRIVLAQPLEMAVRGLGWILVAAGGTLIVVAVSLLRRAASFTVVPRPTAEGRLVESGPYRFVRHPIYGGLVIGSLGLALDQLSWATLLAVLALFVVLDLKRRREEDWLTKRFDGYAAYRHRTRAMLPFIY
jgi:protein-S-isoprenylcysteine O-methyltransferase Ste14